MPLSFMRGANHVIDCFDKHGETRVFARWLMNCIAMTQNRLALHPSRHRKG